MGARTFVLSSTERSHHNWGRYEISLLDFGSHRRLPVIHQSEGAECVMACLAMVLNFHGHCIDLDTLRRRYAVSLKGTTLHDLTAIAGSVGLATRALRPA